MADIWDATTVRVERRGNEMTLHVSINGFEKTVANVNGNGEFLKSETIMSAAEIAETIRSVIIHRLREQLSKIEQADEPGDFTKGNY